MTTSICPECGQTFEVTRIGKIYCSRKCKIKATSRRQKQRNKEDLTTAVHRLYKQYGDNLEKICEHLPKKFWDCKVSEIKQEIEAAKLTQRYMAQNYHGDLRRALNWL